MSATIPNNNISFLGLRNAWNNVTSGNGGSFVVGPNGAGAGGSNNAADPGTTNISLSEFRSAQFTVDGTSRVPASGPISISDHFRDGSDVGYTFGMPSGK